MRELEVAQGELPRFRPVFNHDLVAGFDVVGGDVDVASVDLDVAVGNERARAAASVREAAPKYNVIGAGLEEREGGAGADAAVAPGPRARMLVWANSTAITSGSKTIPASLAVFRVGADGKLDYVRKYDVDTSGGSLFWMGMVPLP